MPSNMMHQVNISICQVTLAMRKNYHQVNIHMPSNISYEKKSPK
ncbi:hypothetical protein MtrunA17_Chr6g0458991 [Medicago truncatula]|uniref:Uncharacterized protein n=1 Tax=Medicago truncatula TaxID=3880 RepID=A0A396HBB7_MEDTR|nr:hypothetical protein MtrunA17_Chr6g0458991 [Medicago truncatula]